MNKFTLSFVAAMSLTTFSCNKKGGDALAKMESFQKAMCECKDKACADKVNIDLTGWKMDLARTTKNDKPDPDVQKKFGDSMMKYADCATKLVAGGTVEASASAPSGKCPDGFTQNPESAFCIKLPTGVKGDGGKGMIVGANDSHQYGWAGGEKGSDFGITVTVSAKNQYYDDTVKLVKDPTYQGKAVADGKFGDAGAWGSGEDGPPPAGYAQRHYIKSVNKSDKMQLTCFTTRATGTGAPSEDEVFEACKTIQFAL